LLVPLVWCTINMVYLVKAGLEVEDVNQSCSDYKRHLKPKLIKTFKTSELNKNYNE